jgi:hypothetical protein
MIINAFNFFDTQQENHKIQGKKLLEKITNFKKKDKKKLFSRFATQLCSLNLIFWLLQNVLL